MPDPNAALLQAKRIDEACDQFESAWRAGKKPQIDAFLAKVSPSDQDALRSALIAVEKELKSQSAIDTSASQSSVKTPADSTSDRTAMFTPVSDAPKRIGRFEIRGVLGAGAFGKIYRGYDAHLGRDVAIKVPLAAVVKSETDKDRFLKEARSAANINHPNVCQIYEVGEFENMPYIVMPVIPGQSLADAIKTKKEPLPEKQVAQIVRKIASALAAAHDKGIIHRDLKPANVMFDKERKDMIVMDFGLARGPMLGEARATQSGMILGTPAYMSPEQARGTSKDVGPAADIFSLGVILYELLTGVRPFSGTATEVIGQILHVDPKAPSEQRAGIDPRMEAICKKAMAKDPTLRFASMRELIAALDAINKAADGKAISDDTAKAIGTKKDRGEPTSENQKLAEVFAVISAERKATAAAVERAVAKHKTPTWIWIALSLLILGGFSALGGIIFFTQNDKVKVTLEIKDLDLTDKTLSFFFDGEPISAEQLANPIELKPGEHIFVAKRGDVIVKRLNLNVPEGADPKIVQEDTTPDPNLPRVELVRELQTTSDEGDCWLTPDGLTIYFTREGANVTEPGVYRAARNTPQSPFGSATYVANARHVALTADESYLVGLKSGQGNQPLIQSRRKDTNEAFGDLSPVPQFAVEHNHKSLWLSSDGLTLVFQRQDEKDSTKTAFYSCRRATRRDIWSAPNRIEIESETPLTLTWPMLSDDGLVLFFGNGGTRFDTELMYATRSTLNEPFRNVRRVTVDGKPVKGRSPRYIAATNELFFTWDPGSKESPKDLGIYVIKNFHPQLNAPAEATSAGWTELFNSKDLSNWQTVEGGDATWKVADGYMEVTPVPTPLTTGSLRKNAIITKQDFPLDFELHAEFWLPSEPNKKDQARSNSGIYLHGRHEIQICDSYQNWIADAKQACGALYNQIGVNEHANLPPETWQTFDIKFQAPRFDASETLTEPGRLTVVLNGKKVINDAIVTSKECPGGVNNNYGKPGPIQLQAHGSAVRFRNLRIRAIKENSRLPTQVAAPKAHPPATMPTGAVLDRGHIYKFFPEQVSWKKAKQTCEEMGGHLIIIDSAEENEFAAKLTDAAGWTDFWIGIADEAKEGEWRTVKGEPIGYTNWFQRQNQPNNKGAGEHFGLSSNRLLANGDKINWEWSDQPNEAQGQHKPGYICEWDSLPLREVSNANWIPLFNGKDLTGWDGDIGYWSVIDGIVVGKKSRGSINEYQYLMRKNPFRDFELKVIAKLVSGNSGIQIRSSKIPATNFDMQGPQIEITNAENLLWGTLLAAPTWKTKVTADATVVRRVLRPTDFNELRIRCVDKHVTISLNNAVVIDTDYAELPPDGMIGLQIHKGEGEQEIHFKEIAIRPL